MSVETELEVTDDCVGILCTHFWVIETPNGPTSMGTCKVCGEERDFRNSVQVSRWESDGGDLRHNASVASRSGV